MAAGSTGAAGSSQARRGCVNFVNFGALAAKIHLSKSRKIASAAAMALKGNPILQAAAYSAAICGGSSASLLLRLSCSSA